MIDADALRALLPGHLVQQRWAGVGERTVEGVELAWLDAVGGGPNELLWLGATARFSDGSAETYQLFLGARPAGDGVEFLQGKDREIVGVVDGQVVYDALIDPELAVAVLHLVAPDREVEVRRPLVLEHSNSSVVYDEALILKVLRKVHPGPNPDVEIPRVLAARGLTSVVAPLAWLSRDGAHLAVLREFLVGATEGWQIAHTSVRDVLGSRLPPEECGADFSADATRIGALLAELHLGLADAFGVDLVAPAVWADDMAEHLAEVAGGPAATPFDPEAVRARFDALRAVRDPAPAVTIHGDLHLAQLVLADTGWYVLDWEGEPLRRRDDRFTRSSPLRDVAGMLRSLHYAAATVLAEWDPDDEELCRLADQWEARNRAAFLDGYLGVEGIAALLPARPEDRAALLAAFELDKAVYEVGYELSHRPDLVGIPAGGVARLLS
ncbi:MAG: hypothetical protein AB7L84_03540 [Acidimicrobiia bacterium]